MRVQKTMKDIYLLNHLAGFGRFGYVRFFTHD